jgi:hypothetical protein
MRSALVLLFLTVLVNCAMPQSAPAPTADAHGAFSELSTLVGRWRGAYANGREHAVTYRLTAADTALLEIWELGPGRESLTIYALDGDHLVATHVCPQGNQPRLIFERRDSDGFLRFKFIDGLNVSAPGAFHQNEFWIRFDDQGRLLRGETYVPNGASDRVIAETAPGQTVIYTRETRG